MLINLWGIVEGGNIICDSMPYIILGSYLVGVKEIFIEWNLGAVFYPGKEKNSQF